MAVIWYVQKMLSFNVWVEPAVALAAAGAVYVLIIFAFKIVVLEDLKKIFGMVLGRSKI